ICQLRIKDRRAQIGEKPQRLAQAEDSLFRAKLARQAVVLPVAYRSKQYRGRASGKIQGAGRQRMLHRVIRGAAYRGSLNLQIQSQRGEDSDRLLRDLRADAVARQNGNTMCHATSLMFVFFTT